MGLTLQQINALPKGKISFEELMQEDLHDRKTLELYSSLKQSLSETSTQRKGKKRIIVSKKVKSKQKGKRVKKK
jgi:hypothetical protein